MAFFRYLLCGFLSLVLALPSPTLCYADDVVSAGGGVDYVQSETKTEEGNQESPEEQQRNDQGSNEESNEGQCSDNRESERSSSGDGTSLYVSSDSNNEEGLAHVFDCFYISTAYAVGYDSADSSSELSASTLSRDSDFADSHLQKDVEDEADPSLRENSSGDSDSSSGILVTAPDPVVHYGDTPDDNESEFISVSNIGDIPDSDLNSVTDLYYSEEAQTLTARAASGRYYVVKNASIGSWISFWANGGWSAQTFITAMLGVTGMSDAGSNDQYFTYNLRDGLLYEAAATALADSNLSTGVTHLFYIRTFVGQIYDRLGGVYDRLGTMISNLGNLYDRMGGLYDRLGSLIEENGTNLTLIYNRLAGIYDRQGTAINGITDIYARVNNLDQNLVHVYNRLGGIYDREATIIEFLSSLNSLVDNINVSLVAVYNTLYDPTTKRPWLQVIGDRFTAYSYMVDAWFTLLSGKMDNLATNETLTTGLNAFDTHILLYLFGNNNGLPAHTEFLDHGLTYYIVQIYEDQKAFFEKALEYFEIYKDRLFYIEYDLVDYGMDIEPGFNRVIEAINTKQFDIQLENADVSINLAGVESRLDTIISMLGIAGAKDLLETFLGDFNLDVSSALAGSIQAAMQNVFPFCVPAILKQILGLLLSEGAPPVFELDFFGSDLTLDFTAYGFAEIGTVTSWFCRIFFLILLLVNTKKFIFVLNRGATDG